MLATQVTNETANVKNVNINIALSNNVERAANRTVARQQGWPGSVFALHLT